MGLSQTYSDEHCRRLRNAGMTALMEVDGKIYLPGGFGQTTAETPVDAPRQAHELMWQLDAWRSNFEGALAALGDTPATAYWAPRVLVITPGFEEWAGFESAHGSRQSGASAEREIVHEIGPRRRPERALSQDQRS